MEARKNLPSRYPFSRKPLEAELHQNERVNNKTTAMGSRKTRTPTQEKQRKFLVIVEEDPR